MGKHILYCLLISAFLLVFCPIYAQSFISNQSFQGNKYVHSGLLQSSLSEPTASSSFITVAPMSYSGSNGYTVRGYQMQSHSKYASNVYSPFSSNSPMPIRRAGSNPFEGGDDDDDDNFNETGGTGDGQGNAGRSEERRVGKDTHQAVRATVRVMPATR